MSVDPFYRESWEALDLGLARLDFQGRLLRANRVFHQIMGIRSLDQQGLPRGSFVRANQGHDPGKRPFLEDFLHPEYRELWRSALREMQEGAEQSLLALVFVLGVEDRPLRLRIKRVRSSGGAENHPQGGLVLLAESLEAEQGGDRHVQEALVKSKQTLEYKSEFLARMSHEIRTPIHTITGLTEILRETRLNEEQADYVQKVSQSADALLSLVDDILDFSKIEAGRMVLEEIPFDLYRVLEQSLDLITPKAHEKGLEILVHLEEGLPHLLVGDPHRLRQVFVNVLSNAVKFTEKGGIRLEIRRKPADVGICLEVEVLDTGMGLSEYKLRHLFDPFFQGDSTHSRRYGGSGLGLSICKSLLCSFQGDIALENRPAGGTRVHFTFCMEGQAVQDLLSHIPPTFLRDYRFLVADPHEESSGLLVSYLAAWGGAVHSVKSADELLAKLGESPDWTLLFCDQSLEGMSDLSLGREIKRLIQGTETRTILTGPAGRTLSAARMRSLGLFDDHITKPLLRHVLLDRIQYWLHGPPEEGDPSLVREGDHPHILPRYLRRVLVVEDHEINRELLRLYLQRQGFSVSQAENGQQALEAFALHKPQIIFMDLQMPVMDGFEAAGEIRKQDARVPIIAVTAGALQEEKNRCQAIGMNGFLTKPFRSEDIRRILDELLRNQAHQDYFVALEEEPQPDPVSGPRHSGNSSRSSDRQSAPEGDFIAEEDVLDWNEALQTFLGNEDLLKRLLKNYLEKVQDHLRQLETARESGDHEKVFLQAHAIKGSSYSLSARRLGDRAAALEKAGRAQDTEGVWKGVGELRKAYEELSAAAQRHLK